MTLEDTDRALRRLREEGDRIGASLLDLELDSTKRLLDAAALVGESKARWEEANATLLELWHLHGELSSVLERAESMRGRRTRVRSDRLVDIDELLRGRQELIERMSADFDAVNATVARIGGRWGNYEPRLHAARGEANELAALFEGLDEEAPSGLDDALRLLAELSETLTRDPLALDPAAVDRLEESLAGIRREGEAVRELSGDLDRHLGEARALLGELRRADAESSTAERERALKIAGFGEAGADARMNGLEAELGAATALCASGALREGRRALAEWSVRAHALLDDLRAAAAEAQASIRSRNELRSLLDAYQARAKRLGVLEDDEVASIHAEAERVLYTAPTDLGRAQELISRYREAMTARAAAREVR